MGYSIKLYKELSREFKRLDDIERSRWHSKLNINAIGFVIKFDWKIDMKYKNMLQDAFVAYTKAFLKKHYSWFSYINHYDINLKKLIGFKLKCFKTKYNEEETVSKTMFIIDSFFHEIDLKYSVIVY